MIFLLRVVLLLVAVALYVCVILALPTHVQLQEMKPRLPPIRSVEAAVFVMATSAIADWLYQRAMRLENRLGVDSKAGQIGLIALTFNIRSRIMIFCAVLRLAVGEGRRVGVVTAFRRHTNRGAPRRSSLGERAKHPARGGIHKCG